MVFHPGILALVSGSFFVSLMMLCGAATGVIVVLRWDFESSSAYQLSLERKTCLISTIMNYVLGFQIISTLLFIYTVDDIHGLFVGAMCATGSLNANPIGWQVLLTKIGVCFAAGFWIVLNYLDQAAEDFPLVRLKYTLLVLLLPFVLLDAYLQLRYFLDLNPEIITSCCGSLFSLSGGGVASSMSGLPVQPTMVVFYLVFLCMLVLSLLCLFSAKKVLRYLLLLFSAGMLPVALVAIVSFISMYIYELPSHRCPFDIFQNHYGFIGYPLYVSLFCGVFFGMLPGMFHPLQRIDSLREKIIQVERPWIYISIGAISAFVMIATYRIVTSNLTYIYY